MFKPSLLVLLSGLLMAPAAEAGRKLTAKARADRRRALQEARVGKDSLKPEQRTHKLTAHERVKLRRGSLAFLQGNLPAAEQLIEQYKLTFPSTLVKVRNANYQFSKLFKIDTAGRIGVLFYLQVDGARFLRAAYRSQSQGSFRILPAINDRAVPGRPGFDKGIGENSLTLPFAVQKHLADQLLADPDPLRLSPTQGFALLRAAVRYNGSSLAWEQYHQALKPQFRTRDFINPQYSSNDPFSVTIANDVDRPVFIANAPAYQTKVSTAGEVDAYHYDSHNAELAYTFFHVRGGNTAGGGGGWIASVLSSSSEINALGVHTEAPNVATLTAPLWEYKQQIAPGFVGKAHAQLPPYAFNWKFVKRLPLTAEWYEAQDTLMPATQSQQEADEEELPATQVLDSDP